MVVRARPPGSVRVLRAEIQPKTIPQREPRDFDPEVIHRSDMPIYRIVLHQEENAVAADDFVPAHGERLEAFAGGGDEAAEVDAVGGAEVGREAAGEVEGFGAVEYCVHDVDVLRYEAAFEDALEVEGWVMGHWPAGSGFEVGGGD